MTNNENNIDQISAAYGKLPPQAVDLEQAVLGALMLEQEALETVSGIIDVHSFYKSEHQKLFEIIKSVAKKKPIDLLTVSQELKDKGLVDEVGGFGYVTQLTRRVASAAHIEHHARIIAQKYYQRETIHKATELIKKAYDSEEVDLISEEWRQAGEKLEDIFTVSNTGTPIEKALKEAILQIDYDCKLSSENQTPGITTGFKGLNENTGGWRNGNLIILAARPGVGKTSFALHFAHEAAKSGAWVNFFSLEMNEEDLTKIMLAAESEVYRSNIRDGYLKDDDWNKINSAVSRLEDLNIIFHNAAGMNINQIQAIIRKNRKKGRCDFVIIDYLQLVRSTQPKSIRELEVSEISRTLKTTSLKENIPILALSQLNRAADGETPKLSNLRESGAIEQDADLVCFLHHPNSGDKSIVRLTVAKHRRGRLAEKDIYCNDEMTRFSE